MYIYIISISNFLEEKYVSYVNTFFLTLGGVNKTFNLHTKDVTFAIIEPSFLNITFIIFENIKERNVFKFIFRYILSIPYFFLENFVGKTLFNLIICWVAIGIEPVSRLFCLCLIVEYFLFLLSLGYFLRLNGVYEYCIKIYGKEFVEVHIDNPMTATHYRMAQRFGIVTIGAIGVNVTDRAFSYHQELHEINSKIEIFKSQNIILQKEDLFKIFDDAKTNNTPLIKTIINPIIGLVKGNHK